MDRSGEADLRANPLAFCRNVPHGGSNGGGQGGTNRRFFTV